MTWTEFVDEAARRGACDMGLELARGHNDWPTAWEDAEWVMRNMHDHLSDEQLWTLAQNATWSALELCSARLTDEQILTLAQQCPWAALTYCSARLSDEQLWTLAQQGPWEALRYCGDRLSDEQIKQLREMV